MEAQAVQVLRYSATLHSNNPKLEKTGTNGSLRMFSGFKKLLFVSSKLQSAKPSADIRRRTASLVVACSRNNIPASTLESGSFHSPVDEKLILKIKSQEIEPYLSGRCIYLVGMMASGKTTVGLILSEALSYSFYDSDALVVEEVDRISVTDIFKHYGEPFFRNKEFQDEAPRKLERFKACKFSAMVHSKKLGRTEPNGSAGWIQGTASTLQSGSFHAPVDEMLILKSKSQEIEPYLNGRCIYLVGMMGSGKTTVGKILSQVLSYLFFDTDALVEEVDGTSVADIFKHNGEPFFRDKETEVLRKLSMMHRHVISTGGGAVVRPIEALAQRIKAVGTDSRPLLHYDEGDAYTKTFMRLFALYKERSEAYAKANVKVSLENMAAKLGRRDVSDLSPTAIAMEALEQIKGFLMGEDGC